MDPQRPARGQADDERADGGRGVEGAQRRAAELAGGQRREQRQRHPEDHRHEVDDIGPDQLLAAARVAEALDDGSPGRRFGVVARRYRSHRHEAGERCQEARRVDAEGGHRARGPDQHAADRGADDHAKAAAQLGQRRHGRELVRRHQPRRHRVERGTLQAVEGRHQAGGQVEHRDRRLGERGVGHQRQAGGHQADLGGDHQAPAIHPVRQRAADERRQQQRHQLHDAEDADREAGVRQGVHLPRQRHVGDHRAEEGHELSGIEQAEVPPAQGTEVHGAD